MYNPVEVCWFDSDMAGAPTLPGNTIGALATGGNEWRRRQFQPILPETHHVSPCYAYRDMAEGETPVRIGEVVASGDGPRVVTDGSLRL